MLELTSFNMDTSSAVLRSHNTSRIVTELNLNTHTHLQVDIYITSDLYNVVYSGESFLSIWHVKANCPGDERDGSLNFGAGIRDKQTWLRFVSVLYKTGGNEGQ